MKFRIFSAFLFLIYETSFYLVRGQDTNEGKSDCTKLMNFLKGDTYEGYDNSCCSGDNRIQCDNEGYITLFNYNNADLNYLPDYSLFPYLLRIENLLMNNVGLKEIPNSILELTTLKKLELNSNNIKEIPSAIQNLSQLNDFKVTNNNINKIPNEIFGLTNLKILYINRNHIDVIPPEIQKLSNLENLYLEENDIKELPDELFNLPNLKKLNLHTNIIEEIPPTIQNLKNLEYLFIKKNNIKKLPRELFNLMRLKKITLHENRYLQTKIINFISSPILECNLSNIDVLCYEQGTCKKITYGNNDKEIADSNAGSIFRICTTDEVDNFYSELSGDKNSSTLIIIGIILGCIIFILIGVLVAFMLIRKRRSEKEKSDIISKDEFRFGSINIVLNKKKENNNDNNDSAGNNNNNDNNNNDNNSSNPSTNNNNAEINNNNNSNGINNNNNNIIINNNDNNQNNLNQNIVEISNDSNLSPTPGMVVLINDPQNPGNYVMSNMSLFNNHNSIQNFIPLSHNISINSDEPPPEYTEFSEQTQQI